MKDEERHLFPELRDGAPPFVLARLGQQVRAAKNAALSRSHPQAPSVPPLDKLLAPGLGLVDRVRDQATKRGHPVTS